LERLAAGVHALYRRAGDQEEFLFLFFHEKERMTPELLNS
jgi:hypothetical protein